MQQVWRKPGVGWFKINVDAAAEAKAILWVVQVAGEQGLCLNRLKTFYGKRFQSGWMFGTRHPEPSQPPRATPATPIRSGQVAPGRFVQGPLRDPTRGPGFGRSLRCVFRSTGSAEGGGGGDEDLWVWDSRSKTRTVGLGFYFRWVAVVICWWATGCCGGSPTKRAWVCADLDLDLGVVAWWLTVGNGLRFVSILISTWWRGGRRLEMGLGLAWWSGGCCWVLDVEFAAW
uniref:Uncharacterized protein n=1 Tax=Fagus sylvatica TaxID=28930 RepID=A0A2N9ILS3_FAGSY